MGGGAFGFFSSPCSHRMHAPYEKLVLTYLAAIWVRSLAALLLLVSKRLEFYVEMGLTSLMLCLNPFSSASNL